MSYYHTAYSVEGHSRIEADAKEGDVVYVKIDEGSSITGPSLAILLSPVDALRLRDALTDAIFGDTSSSREDVESVEPWVR